MKHAYLWAATFADTTQIIQTQEDKSFLDPKRSLFYDVLEKEKESPLISFVLIPAFNTPEDIAQRGYAQTAYGVDLQDGHFEVGGIPFFQHRQDTEPYKDFRLIYYRTVQQQVNVTNGDQVHPLETVLKDYTFGWQTTYKGRNVKRIIRIVL